MRRTSERCQTDQTELSDRTGAADRRGEFLGVLQWGEVADAVDERERGLAEELVQAV
jgi:hypothetical protein